jgi:hypothetical protein
MIRRFLQRVLLLGALVAPLAPTSAAPREPASTTQKQECTVYITRTGKRYHRAGCHYLHHGAVAMTREEALKRGLTPCHVCGGSDCER